MTRAPDARRRLIQGAAAMLLGASWLAAYAQSMPSSPSSTGASTATIAPAGQTITDDVKPFVVEAYYKVRWGSAGEFIRLFKKNHLPILRQQMAEGRILSLKAESPFHHVTEDGRWDLRVTITWRNAVVAHDDYDGAALVRRLFPDEATFRREEQHRFELLLSHWDLVITPVDLGRS